MICRAKSSWFGVLLLGLFLLLARSINAAEPATRPAIAWVPFSQSAFDQAKREHKLILLDLHAGWCHWCHVMDDITYSDPQITAYLGAHFITIGADQDSRPDLSNRYEDYGWPATIIYNSDGQEIVKRAGYIPPQPMLRLLQACVADPTPGPSAQPAAPTTYTDQTTLAPETRTALLQRYQEGYDAKQGGWGDIHKYLDWDNLEYALRQNGHDPAAAGEVHQTLDGALQLVDPAWGGVYQYSTDDDWVHPHFEKIMQMQAEDMRLYSLAYLATHDERYLAAARHIENFLHTFLLSPDGGFYTSMDADLIPGQHAGDYFALDDAGRRKLGVPHIDRNQYARENGWAITGLAALYAATGEQPYLDEARAAAVWTLAHRAVPGGGFRHGETDTDAAYLGDTLAMGRAWLSLYGVSGDRSDLAQARRAAKFIQAHFAAPTAGYLTTTSPGATPNFDENVTLVRWGSLLYAYTGQNDYKAMAQHAMKFVATPDIVLHRHFSVGGALLADADLSTDPVHVIITGSKSDPKAQLLFKTALHADWQRPRIEWLDAQDGPLPRDDSVYPVGKTARAFVCGRTSCRTTSDPHQLTEFLAGAS